MIQTTNVTTNHPCALRVLRVTCAATFITAALLAVGMFLALNGYRLTAPQADANFMEQLYQDRSPGNASAACRSCCRHSAQ